MLQKQIVVARYNEDVSWATGQPAIIYNKGATLDAPVEQRPLPNVGRESHTYLRHIVDQWDDLADSTLFTQARFADHVPPGVDLNALLGHPADMVVPNVISVREWGADGRIDYLPGIHRERLAAGQIKRSDLSLVDWFRVHLQIQIDAIGSITFMPGAVFAVRRACVHRRPREFYRRLLSAVETHVDPEEGYYMERSWLYVFGLGHAQVQCVTPARR